MKKVSLASIGEVLAAQRRAAQSTTGRTKAAKSRPAQAQAHPDALTSLQK